MGTGEIAQGLKFAVDLHLIPRAFTEESENYLYKLSSVPRHALCGIPHAPMHQINIFNCYS